MTTKIPDKNGATTRTADQESAPIASVDKALRVIDYLSSTTNMRGVALSQISQDLHINKATLHHILAALRHREWAEHAPDGTYRIGPGSLKVVRWWTSQDRLIHELHPIMVQICDRIHELVHMGRLSERHILYLDKVEPQRPIMVRSRVGLRVPAVVTALGRALMSASGVTADTVDPWIAIVPHATDSLRTHALEELRRVQTDGYAMDLEENELGVNCVAIPISVAGQPRAALSISVPSDRFSDHRAAELAGTAIDVISRASMPNIEVFTDKIRA
jgi:DNA-binding IclR family transcriptional regulator